MTLQRSCSTGKKSQAHEEEEMLPRATRRDTPRRATRGVLPARYSDYVLGMIAMEEDDPVTFKEAVSCTQKEEWLRAMEEEYKSLNFNSTWELVDPPANRNIVGCKWVYRKKLDAEGNVERFKARLVAQGFTQRAGSDYDETFAPVAMQSTVRTLLAVAGDRKMLVKHLDIKTAYLYGTLKEEIYMRQPPGFVEEHRVNQVCKLRKSIYGLKQAARVWHQTITGILSELGFTQCRSDTCLYKKRVSKNVWIYLLIYVDARIKINIRSTSDSNVNINRKN